jgi:hypothetical protein
VKLHRMLRVSITASVAWCSITSCNGDSTVLVLNPVVRIRAFALSTGAANVSVPPGGSVELAIRVFSDKDSSIVGAKSWQSRSEQIAVTSGSIVRAIASGHTYVVAEFATDSRTFRDSVSIVVTGP